MFCPNCGAACDDGAVFCGSCGNAMQPQAPQQPAYQAPQQTAQATDFVGILKKNWTIIIAAVAVFALLMGILTTFCILEAPATAKAAGYSETEYGTVSDISDALEALDGSFAGGIIGNILFGLINLAIAGVGALYFLKQQKNMPYYDQFVGKFLKGMSPALVMGAAGAAGAVVQFILYLISGVSKKYFGVKMSVSVSVPWLTWVALVIYAALAAVDFLLVNKKQK